MKKLIVLCALIAIVTSFATGCASVQDTSGKSLIAIETTVDAAMKGWAVWVAEGHATVEQQAQVESYYKQYQAAFSIACNTWIQAQQSGNTSVMTGVLTALSEDAAPLTTLITQIEGGK